MSRSSVDALKHDDRDLRKGEALALHSADVDVDNQMPFAGFMQGWLLLVLGAVNVGVVLLLLECCCNTSTCCATWTTSPPRQPCR